MNIFYLDNDPEKCAQFHVNSHVIKMITETCQLLSTAHRVLDGKEYIDSSSGRKIKRWSLKDNEHNHLFYKATHVNHPSAIWTRQSSANYKWLVLLLKELCKEYTFRYGKIHKCEEIGLVNLFYYFLPINMPNNSFTEPALAMPEEFRIPNDAIKSYHNYYNGSKQHLHAWKNRETPYFIKPL